MQMQTGHDRPPQLMAAAHGRMDSLNVFFVVKEQMLCKRRFPERCGERPRAAQHREPVRPIAVLSRKGTGIPSAPGEGQSGR